MLAAQRGFSLPEMLIAMLISGLLLSGTMSLLPTFQRQSLMQYRAYRLEQALGQVLQTVEKDLRRAGYLFASTTLRSDEMVKIVTSPSGDVKACVLLSYDLNHNGRIEPEGVSLSERFGYRWRQGIVERQRGVSGCQGGEWEKMLDPSEIVVSGFLIERRDSRSAKGEGEYYFDITLSGHWRGQPAVVRTLVARVKGRSRNP
ncbi:prepilin peptidase-dependent protein [Leminorella grimontii]|uniref:prepilin peptidase-dependent protein n=1 Tax=Leminorella grimontii TaxID=82981 RepID=UPI00321F9362